MSDTIAEGEWHPSHNVRYSDSSLYDEICTRCQRTDGGKQQHIPCPNPQHARPAASDTKEDVGSPDHDEAMRIADGWAGPWTDEVTPTEADVFILARAYKDVVRERDDTRRAAMEIAAAHGDALVNALTPREAWWLKQVVPPDIEVPPADIPTFKVIREKLRRIAARAATTIDTEHE